jgi:hypothetical protein
MAAVEHSRLFINISVDDSHKLHLDTHKLISEATASELRQLFEPNLDVIAALETI